MTLHVQEVQHMFIYFLFVFDVSRHDDAACSQLFRVEALGEDQAARRTTMSKAPRSQPCLATAAPMAKTPGFHRFDVANPSPNLQAKLSAKHPSVAEGPQKFNGKTRQAKGNMWHRPAPTTSATINVAVKKAELPPVCLDASKVPYLRTTLVELSAWCEHLDWCFWKRLLWHQIFTRSFELQFLQTPGIVILLLTAVSLKPECLKSFRRRWCQGDLGPLTEDSVR